MRSLRIAGRFVADLFAYGWTTGRWWVPLSIVLFLVAVSLALTAKAVVGPAMYVLF